MEKLTRRLFLCNTAAVGAAGATIAAPAIADTIHLSPDERIEAAAAAIEAAMREKYPDWQVQVKAGLHHVQRYIGGGFVDGDPHYHLVMVYASKGAGTTEDARLYTHRNYGKDDGPLLADDVTGTTAYADWERRRRSS